MVRLTFEEALDLRDALLMMGEENRREGWRGPLRGAATLIQRRIDESEGEGDPNENPDDPIDFNECQPLLKRIIDVLKAPNVRNILTGETVRLLRDTALLPMERAEIQARLKDTQSCASCGKDFNQGELIIYARTFLGDDQPLHFVCGNCASPSQVACGHKGCKSGWELPGTLVKFFQVKKKRMCREHRKEESGQTVQSEPTVQDPMRIAEFDTRQWVMPTRPVSVQSIPWRELGEIIGLDEDPS
jgi:hypothetical protein